MGRVLAVDTGTRRVGLAITDPLGMICSPLSTIPFVSESALARSLLELCRQKEVSLVVVGLPVSADGSEGEGCARARRIRDRLLADGLACELWDESWSSREAADALRAVGARPHDARGRLDAMAAALILRDYIETSARSAASAAGPEAPPGSPASPAPRAAED